MSRWYKFEGIAIPFVFCSSFLFLACAACAEQKTTLQKLNGRLTKLEKDFHRSVNPPSLLAPGFLIQADVLFWQARETGLSYAIIASNPLILEVLPRNFDIKEPEFEWDFGFRAGAGYGGKSDGWDLFSLWTRFVTDAHDNGMIASEKFFLPVWGNPSFLAFPFDHITEAEAHWKLHFDEIDAGVGRGFYISKSFTVRPFAGPSAVWINQHYHIEYEKPAIRTIPTRTDSIHLKNDFFGIGARIGCELRYRFTQSLSLLTKGSGAIYAGHFEVQRKEKFDSLLGKQSYKIAQNIRAGCAAIALEMGFCWERKIHNKYYVRAELCYDIQYFFKQNQMPRVLSKVMSASSTYFSDQGDLALHGGSFSVTFGF